MRSERVAEKKEEFLTKRGEGMRNLSFVIWVLGYLCYIMAYRYLNPVGEITNGREAFFCLLQVVCDIGLWVWIGILVYERKPK